MKSIIFFSSSTAIAAATLLFSFAAIQVVHATQSSSEYKAGYQRELSDWTLIVVNGTNGELKCPLASHSDYCLGYNDAMHAEANHQ